MLSFIAVLALFGCSAQIIPTHRRIRSIRSSRPQPRIINGMKVPPTDYPYMVSLRADLYYPNGTFDGDISFCGGVLIQVDPPAVLTAAHCVDLWTEINSTNATEQFGGFGPYQVEIYADLNRTYPDGEVPGDEYYSLKVTDILQIAYHPQWNFSDISNAYDIGVIIFSDGQTVADGLTQDMLPTIPAQLGVNEECCVEGETITIVGYGQYGPVHDSDQNYSNSTGHTLETTTMEYTNMEACLDTACPFTCNVYEFPGEMVMCVEAPSGVDTGICRGDSGGPMLRIDSNDSSLTLLGIASLTLGDGCAIEAGSAGMSVAHHSEWINGILNFEMDPPEICSDDSCVNTTYTCASMYTCAPTASPTTEADGAATLWSLCALLCGLAVTLKM